MLKQNKFISIISIGGTALAIMMIMAIVVSRSVNNISIAPEPNRDRLLYLKIAIKKNRENDGISSRSISYSHLKEYFYHLKTPEKVTAIAFSYGDKHLAKTTNIKNRIPITLKQTDNVFWDVMALSFIEGKPFTKADFDSGMKNAVISEQLAKKLFGNEPALGKSFDLNFTPYKVTGVVKDVSKVFQYAYADVWIPYTSKNEYEDAYYNVLLLSKNKRDFEAIKNEVRECERKYDATDDKFKITFMGPYDQEIQKLNTSNMFPDEKGYKRRFIFIIAVLLLIPAINLSGFSLSRIKRRTEEIGIRKAFGAKKYTILAQVLYENMITSIIGGLIGLVLSYFMVSWLKEWLLGVNADSTIPLTTVISIPVFIAAFTACILLNLLSSGIPAYRASKMKIVDSITKKEE